MLGIILTVLTILIIIAIIVIAWAVPVKGKVSNEHWYSKMEYPDEYAINIEKKPNKDFEILAIADMQLSDTVEVFGPGDPLKEIEELIKRRRPDMIMIMGDITWTGFTKISFNRFVKFIDKFDIPFATIFGNHEEEREQGFYGNVDKNWCADKIMSAKNSIFKKGPNNIGGVGNYVINITENGKTIDTLIMMDTHAQRIYPELGGKKDYDYIYDSQISWYKWVINGIQSKEGKIVPSMLFIHTPLCEYSDAYKLWEKSGFDPSIGFGNRHEDECPGAINSGMFDVIKKLNSTKYVFAGHDHSNNYSVEYEGIRLTYTTKTGYKTSFAKGQTGGTYITINGNNDVKIEHSYIKH